MNRTRFFLLALLLAGGLFGGKDALAAEPDGNEKALKYYAILEKRPDPGYLFDRFYNAWLDRSTVESLESFLSSEVAKRDTTAHRLLLAFLYVKQNNDPAAIEEFNKALKSDPQNASIWYHKALALSRTLDFEAAIADLKKAKSLKTDEKLAKQIQRRLGTMLARNRQTDEAVAVWKSLLAANPTDDELCEDIIELHLDEGLYKPAIALSKSLVERTKDPYAVVTRHLRLGDIYYRAGQRTKAIEVYTSTLSKTGHGSWLEKEILAQIEQIFRYEDDLAGLKKQYDKLLETYPKRISLQRRRCRLLVQLDEKEEAIKSYRKVLELTPGDRGNREEYIDMLCRLDENKLAVKEVEVLYQQHPKDAELQIKLAKILHKAGETKKAVETVERYLKMADQTEYVYLRAARLVEQFGGKKEAAAFYQKMAEKFADSFSAQNVYAAFLHNSGKKEKAIAIWKKLAKDNDINSTLNVARSLITVREKEVAFELMKSREKEFSDKPLYLGQLAKTALELKEYRQAMPWVKRRVELSKNITDLENAITQAIEICKKRNKLADMAEKLEAIQDRSVPLTCLLAELLENLGKSERADQILKKPADEGNLFALGQQVRLHRLRHEWAKAADATKQLLTLGGGRQSLYVRRLVELYEQDDQLGEALKWAGKWKQLAPGLTTPWLAEARIMQKQGESEQVQATLRKAIQRFDKDEEIRVCLAQIYASTGKAHDAARMYWQLYEQNDDPTNKLRWAAELAKLARQEGDTAKLIENFRDRHRGNRRSIVPLLAIAEIYRVNENYEDGRQALLEAAKIQPDNLALLSHIAGLEEKEGNWQEAVTTLQQAVKFDKTDQIQKKIARLHIKYGDIDKGYAILRDLIFEKNPDPRSLEQMVLSLCSSSEWERAIELLEPQVAKYPEDYRLRYLLALCHEEMYNADEAASLFLTLLNCKEKPKNVAKNISQGSSPYGYSYASIFRDLMPVEIIEWIMVLQSRHYAYSYKQQPGYPGPSGYMSGSGQTVAVPATAEEMRRYSIAHLAMISKEFDESKKAELLSDLKARGTYRPDVLFKMLISEMSERYVIQELSKSLKKNPDEEPLLAMVVCFSCIDAGKCDVELLLEAFEKFHKKRPMLAFLAGVRAASLDPKHASLLNKSIELVTKMERPNPLLITSVVSTLGGSMRPGHHDFKLTQEQRAKLTELLLEWYAKDSSANQPYGFFLFYQIAQVLQGHETPTTYFTFLDNEVAKSRKSNKSSNNVIRQPYGPPGESTLFKLPSFPPEQLADFPENVLQILSKGEERRYFMMDGPAKRANWKPDQLKPAIEKVKDQTLRLLLANYYEVPDMADTILKAMLKEKTPRMDAYLLAATKAGSDSRFEEAIRLLEKARHLSMKKDLRQKVDAMLVAIVLAAEEKAEKESAKVDKKLLEIGCNAALRLRRYRLEKQDRAQLVQIFEKFGMKEEAEKLDKNLNASNGSLVSPSAHYRGYSEQASEDRIVKLLEAGKRETAARLLLNEVRAIGKQAMSDPQDYQYYSYSQRELHKRIQEFDIADDIIKLVEPEKTESRRRQQEYALICEVLERKDEAQKVYEKLLEKHPKDSVVRLRLIMLLCEKKQDAIAKHIDKLSADALGNLGSMLSRSTQDSDLQWENRFRHIELLIHLMKRIKAEKRADVSWAEKSLQEFGENMHNNSNLDVGSLPSLYVKETSDDREQHGKYRKIHEKRAKLHHDLCLAMMDVPELGRKGFGHLFATAVARGEDIWKISEQQKIETPTTEKKGKKETKPQKPLFGETGADYRDYAEKVLFAEADNRSQRPVDNYFHSSRFDEDRESRFLSPETFLVYQAWELKDWKRLEEVVLPKLAKSRDKTIHKRLASRIELYRCPGEEFLKVAEKCVKNDVPTSRVMMMGMPSQEESAAAHVVVAWDKRALKVDIAPILYDALQREIDRGNLDSKASTMMSTYFAILTQHKKYAKINEVLDKMTTLYLGPVEKRREFIKENYDQNSITWGTPNANINQYIQIVEVISHRDATIFLILPYLEPFDLLGERDFPAGFQNAMAELLTSKTEEFYELVELSPWLADFEHFRVLPVGKDATEWPLVYLLNRSELYQKPMNSFWEKLKKDHAAKPTFGKELFLAMAAAVHKKDPSALPEFFEKHLDKIKKLPAERQEKFSLCVDALLSNVNCDPSRGKAAWEWIRTHRGKRTQGLLDKFRKAKKLEDLKIRDMSYWRLQEYLGNMMTPVIRSDPKTANEIFAKMVALAEDARKRNKLDGYYVDGENTVGSQLFDSILDQLDDHLSSDNLEANINALLFMIDSYHSPEGEKLNKEYHADNVIKGVLEAAIKQAQKDGKCHPDSVWSLETVRGLHETLGERLGKRSSVVLVPYLDECLRKQKNPRIRQAIADWAKKESQDGKYPELAAHIHACVRLQAAEKTKKDAEVFKAQEYFRKLIASDRLPVLPRMAVAERVIDSCDNRLSPELAHDIMVLYVQAMEKDIPIPDEAHQRFWKVVFMLQDNPGAADLVKRWRTVFAKEYLQTNLITRPHGGQVSPRMIYLSPFDFYGQVLEVYLKADDIPRVQQFLKKYDDVEKVSPVGIAQLVRYGKIDLAAQAFLKNNRTINIIWPEDEMGRYDGKIQKHMPELIAKLEKEEDRYAAEVILATMNDPPKNKPKEGKGVSLPFPDREKRLVALAKKLKAIQFKSVARKSKLTIAMLTCPKAQPFLAEEMEAAYKKIKLPENLGYDDHRIEEARLLLVSYTRLRALEGNLGPFLETMEKLSKPRHRFDYVFNQLGASVLHGSGFQLLADGKIDWTPEQSKAVAKILRDVMKRKNRWDDVQIFSSMAIASHIWAGETDEFLKFFESLPEEQRKLISRGRISPQIWELQIAGLKRTKENLPERLDFVRQTFRIASRIGWMRWDSNAPFQTYYTGVDVFERVEKSGILSTKEIIAHCPKMVKEVDKDGLFTTSLARWLHQKKKYKEAIALWQSAIDAEKGKDQAKLWHWKDGLTESLRAIKKNNQPIEMLKKIGLTALYGDDGLKEIEKLNKELDKLQEKKGQAVKEPEKKVPEKKEPVKKEPEKKEPEKKADTTVKTAA